MQKSIYIIFLLLLVLFQNSTNNVVGAVKFEDMPNELSVGLWGVDNLYDIQLDVDELEENEIVNDFALQLIYSCFTLKYIAVFYNFSSISYNQFLFHYSDSSPPIRL